MPAVIERRVAPSVQPADVAPREVARELRRLLDAGARLRPAGSARRDPRALLTRYTPKYTFALFDTRFYLADVRQIPEIRFFVAYVVPAPPARRARSPRDVFPRIFYKDVSLVWRAASHYLRTDDGLWIGKGEVRAFADAGGEVLASVEATTDLPFEMQSALEALSRRGGRVPQDERALDLVLRRGPRGRIEPYRDFLEPRRRARADRRNRVYGGRSIARFTRRGDPASLRFAPGYEPDFAAGIVERSESTSSLYGGRVRRFRILSRNRQVQFLFFAGPRLAWLAPPQATTTELSSFGVRTVDVVADEDLSIPGYEYHFVDEGQDPPALVSQIPAGYAGAPSEVDDLRADASAWLERLPVVRQFRLQVLGRADP